MRHAAALAAAVAAVLAAAPAHALAQSGPIVLQDDFGVHFRGDAVLINGRIAVEQPGAYLIMQVANPRGDLCQIQQLSPLPGGAFVADRIQLSGHVCGMPGEYEVRLFYGDSVARAPLEVSGAPPPAHSGADLAGAAAALVESRIAEAPGASRAALEGALAAARSSADPVPALRAVHADAWAEIPEPDVYWGLDAGVRPAVESLMAAAAGLADSGDASASEVESIRGGIVDAAFHYQIGDRAAGISGLHSAFRSISGSSPEGEAQRPLTFSEIEESLLNILKKTRSIFGTDVKEEIATIFSRGQGPLHVEEISAVQDMGSKARYLDAVLRNNATTYRLIHNQWESLKPSLVRSDSLAELAGSQERVDTLHRAALVLRSLDGVERFIGSPSGEAEEKLAELLDSEWDDLAGRLARAVSVDQILENEGDIYDMKAVADISSRISKAVTLSERDGIDPDLEAQWESLLGRIGSAATLSDIRGVVAEFDATLAALRDERSPAAILLFEYRTMKAQAEAQADYGNLAKIEQALSILEAAARLSEGASQARSDRVEILLTWAAKHAPAIRADLDDYTREEFKERAGDILHRANSLDVRGEMSLDKRRFLPGYLEFVRDVQDRLDEVRSLATSERLFEAEGLLTELQDEWGEVTAAYERDPSGGSAGHSLSSLKKADYRERADVIDGVVDDHESGFDGDEEREYYRLVSALELSVETGNFADADRRLRELGEYVEEHLSVDESRIMYDVVYDEATKVWKAEGHLDKDTTRRGDVDLYVRDGDGGLRHHLEFSDTRTGYFATEWRDSVGPGIYLARLEWNGLSSVDFVFIGERGENLHDASRDDPRVTEAARVFEELRRFAESHGWARGQNPAFDEVSDDVLGHINEGDARQAEAGIAQMRLTIERSLPERHREAVVEASYGPGGISVRGAVAKSVDFREDLYVDIRDAHGDAVATIPLQDTGAGYFEAVHARSLQPGIYSAHLEYHDLAVTDFFTVG